MRTMILLIVLYGTFPEWLRTLGIVWYILTCAKWWFRVWYEHTTGIVIGTILGSVWSKGGNNMKWLRNKLGFTIIELVLVIAILGILAVAVSGLYSTYSTKINEQTQQVEDPLKNLP